MTPRGTRSRPRSPDPATARPGSRRPPGRLRPGRRPSRKDAVGSAHPRSDVRSRAAPTNARYLKGVCPPARSSSARCRGPSHIGGWDHDPTAEWRREAWGNRSLTCTPCWAPAGTRASARSGMPIASSCVSTIRTAGQLRTRPPTRSCCRSSPPTGSCAIHNDARRTTSRPRLRPRRTLSSHVGIRRRSEMSTHRFECAPPQCAGPRMCRPSGSAPCTGDRAAPVADGPRGAPLAARPSTWSG
jgi:hypothetical protein